MFHCITSIPLKPAESETWMIWNTPSKTGTIRNTHSSIFTEAIFERQNAEKEREEETGKRRRGRESGGLEMDEGHISSHWAGNSEKSPWLLRNQRQKIPAEGWGQRNKPVLLFFVLFYAVFRVVSHSALEKRCVAASRLARSLSIRI